MDVYFIKIYTKTHNNAKQMRKTNGCTKKKKKDEHTKERAENE